MLGIAGCADSAGAEPEKASTPQSSAPSSSASKVVERDILDLINAVTPLPATAPQPEKNAWYGRRKDTLDRLRTATHAHGLEALRVYHERKRSLPEIRKGLLDIAAHNAPEECAELLESLVTTYGEDLGLRSYAAEVMGSSNPELALRVIEPILRGQRQGVTYPQFDILLGSWSQAAETLGVDRTPVVCEVAIDPGQTSVVRHAATKMLGTMPSEQGRQALERILIETGHDGMIRRFAAQSLAKTVPDAELCEIIQRTLEREQDTSFQQFLFNLSQERCR